jgi:hypothetical protein
MFDRAKKALAIVAFLALFGFLAFQTGVAFHHPQGRYQESAAAHDGEQKNIFVRFWEWTTDDPVAAYTLVLAISTIGLWWVTGSGIRIQAKDTRILQRAYVSIEPMGLTLLIDGSHLLGLVSIKNAGNLPARNLSWSIRMLASLNGELETLPSFDIKGSIVLAPHSETTCGSDGRLIVSDLLGMAGAGLNRMDEKPVFIYVFGIIEYHDGFTDGRITRFCHRYNYKIRPQIVGPAQYSMSRELARQHTHGNEST